ncbi:MAG: hypothetical protein Q4C47_08630 [Planctomycetia bacterium]|nr:hypothetical protein [Planctomycetia bacterium]
MAVLRIVCPHCGVRLRGDVRLAGRKMSCPQCKQPFTITPPTGTTPVVTGKSPELVRPTTSERPTNVRSVPPSPPSPGTTGTGGDRISEDAIADLLGTHRPREDRVSGNADRPGATGTTQTPRTSPPAIADDGRIPLDDVPDGTLTTGRSLIVVSDDPGIHPLTPDPDCRYLVVGPSRLFAMWENPEHGWMIRGTTNGWDPLAGNTTRLPRDGDYRLVTLRTFSENGEVRIRSLRSQQLPKIGPMASLVHSDGAILGATMGDVGLLRDQKLAISHYLRERFMPEVLVRSRKILDYLADYDLTTSQVHSD